MATSYPAAFDNLSNPLDGDIQATGHGAQHRNANDAIEAIEAELGLLPKGVSATVAARLTAIEASIAVVGQTAATALPSNSITLAKMAANAVDSTVLADNAVSNTKLTADSVSTSKIQNLAVTTAKLAEGSVTSTKLSGITYNTSGLDAARPLSATAGAVWYSTDTFREWRHNGTTWVLVGWNATAGRIGVQLSDAAQSITTVTATDITWGTEVLDPDGWTSGGSAILTVPTGFDGIYMVTYNGTWGSSTLGTTPGITALINSTITYSAYGLAPGAVHSLTFVAPLAAGTTIKFQAFQNSGGSVNVTSALNVVYLGR